MRRFVVAFLAFGLVASQALAANTQPQPTVSSAQARALADLPEVTTVTFDGNGIPTFLAGHLGHLGPGSPEGAALRYVEGLRPLLRGTGREEIAPSRTERDDLGLIHVRLQQYRNGLPVVGGELVVHADEATGEVRVVNGHFAPDEGLPSRARLSARAALLKTAQDADIRDGRVLDQPTLVYVVANDSKTYLAWSALIAYNGAQGPTVDRVFASAIDGDLVTMHPTIYSVLNRKIYNGNHTNPDAPTLPGTLIFQEGGSSTDAAANDCYTNFGYTYNYYKTRFNRDSFDNTGSALIGTVHVGTNWVNAYWNGTQMVFGDGDGTQATYLSKALDVVAHELTHAVTDRTAGLNYESESGALNEAMSDILGAGAEAYRDGAISANTWKVGEEVWTPGTAGDALRYMNNPTQDGSSTDYWPTRNYASGCTPSSSNDYCGVHTNSGIANLAFYLLSQGGTHPRGVTTVSVPAITIAKAEQIFYRALTTGLMTSTTNFQGARNATKTAAEQLYTVGGAESTAVTACWDAVAAPGGTTPVTTLSNGVSLASQGASTGNYLNYKITVPSGQTSLVVTTTGGTGDADLYVKAGTLATSSTYDGKSTGSTSAETVTITNPTATDYYIGLYAYSTFSGVTIKATYTGSTADFAMSASPTSVSVAQGSSGTSTITTTVSGGFNIAVALTSSGAPSGATVSFSPTSIAAPGSGTSTMTIAAGTAAAGTTSITVTGTGGGKTHTATVSLTVTASGGGVTVLTNGQTVTGISVATGAWKHYKIAVPASQTSLAITMSGGTGDGDMYVKLGAQPTSSVYDYRPYLTGNNESVSVTNPAAGDWYISIYGYSACSGVSLVATYSAGGGTTMNETESNNTTATANTIATSGTTVTGYLSTSTDVDYFKVTLAAGRTLTGDLTVPSTKDYDLKFYNSAGTTLASGTNGSGVAEHVTYTNSGTSSLVVYIKVYGYNSAYSATLAYTLKATF
jgi:vibriolysin